MSKGTPRITIRIAEDMLAAINSACQSRNEHQSAQRPWDRCDWIIEAIAEKLAKTLRGRKKPSRIKVYKTEENKPREVFGHMDTFK